jgi:hypothetical protein
MCFTSKILKLILTASFLILFAADAPAQLAKIAGVVVDSQPARITEAKILVAGKRDTKEFATDEEGFFQGDLKPGWFIITISHYGFRTRKFKMFLKPDVVTPLNVTLTVGSQKIGKCPKGAICL